MSDTAIESIMRELGAFRHRSDEPILVEPSSGPRRGETRNESLAVTEICVENAKVRRHLPWIAVFCTSCSSKENLLVDLPEALLAPGGSLIIALEGAAGFLHLAATDVDGDRATLESFLPEVPEYTGESLKLTVLRSDQPLSALDLSAGDVPLSQVPTDPKLTDLFSDDAQSLVIEGGDVGTWTRVDDPSGALGTARSPRYVLCDQQHTRISFLAADRLFGIRGIGFRRSGGALYAALEYVRNATDTGWDTTGVVGTLNRMGEEIEITRDHRLPDVKEINGLVGDGSQFFLATTDKVLVMDEDGVTQKTIPLPDAGDFRLTMGSDGAVFAVSPTPESPYFELTDSSTAPIARSDFPGALRAMSARNKNHRLAYSAEPELLPSGEETGAYIQNVVSLFSDGEWSTVLEKPEPVTSYRILDHPSGASFAANSDVYFEQEGTWTAFPGTSLGSGSIPRRGMAPIGEGRHFVVGDVGLAMIYDPSRDRANQWCTIEPPSNRNNNQLVFDPSLRQFIAFEGVSVRRLPESEDVEIAYGSVVTWFEVTVP